MENALDKALANASLNARMNGDTLHTENLDSIADPSFDELPDLPNLRTGEIHSAYRKNGVSYVELPESIPRPVSNYQQMMEAKYTEKLASSNQSNLTLNSIDYKLGEITNAVMHTHKEAELTKLRLDALADMITEISTTITTAAQSMSTSSNLKHRSLDQWDDSQLLNELVERENDLMPFYYELLKRIGSPELQKLVMSSMQGKNASMVTLAQLCSALAPQPAQSQYPHISEAQRTELKARSELDRIAHEQGQHAPTTIPQQQYFGQATEEYIKSLYTDKPVQNRIG